MARAKANRSRSILDLLESRRDSSSYKTSIPSKRPWYLHTSVSHSAPGQGTSIAETIEKAAEDQGLEGGEIDEKEEEKEWGEDNDSENMPDYFCESDSIFEVDPQPEARWHKILGQELKRDLGNNRHPLVPRTDGEFAHRYNDLLIGIFKWSSKYFSYEEPNYDLAKLQKYHLLISYIDLIAVARDPNTHWKNVIETLTPRLVMALIMKIIQIHIFGLELFGASESQLEILQSADRLRTEPSHSSTLPTIFKRQEIRAGIINSFYPSQSSLPNTLQPDILKVANGIVSLLKPLVIDPASLNSRYAHSLTYLLVDAARLHFDMRREPDTIYFVHGLTPGDRIDSHTQCEVPLLPTYTGPEREEPLPTYTEPERKDPKQRIHIVIAPGIVALRRFGPSYKFQYQTHSVADAMAVAEWVDRDHRREAPKELSNYLDYWQEQTKTRQETETRQKTGTRHCRHGPSSEEFSPSPSDGHDQDLQ